LYQQGFRFQFLFPPLAGLLSQNISLDEYLLLDESFMQMTMMQWTREQDPILADLCSRFMHRRLFKYVVKEQLEDDALEQIQRRMRRQGIDPEYYLAVDFPADYPYDVYDPGKTEQGKLPVYLLEENGELTEISTRSEIVRSLSGIQIGKYYVYYPGDWFDISE
jgi:hypothetical protein